LRTAVGIWLLRRTVILPLAGSQLASTPRGSSGVGASRWFSSSTETTWAARAKAAAAAASSPCRLSAQTLSGASGQIGGAPGATASAGATTAGSSS
jgi:hypothetical protein